MRIMMRRSDSISQSQLPSTKYPTCNAAIALHCDPSLMSIAAGVVFLPASQA
jgi:hypothetical protein